MTQKNQSGQKIFPVQKQTPGFTSAPMAKNSSSDKTNNTSELQNESEMLSNDASAMATKSEINLQELDENGLRQWVAQQAPTLDSTRLNTSEVELKLTAEAQALTPEQLKSLKNIVLENSLPINNRIFSAYLLTLNATETATEQLAAVARAPTTDFGPLLPHSEAELRHSQEMALRFMQVDELFERAKTDTQARKMLKSLSEQANSAQIRSYARKRYSELKT
jgi:hypothetical protein